MIAILLLALCAPVYGQERMKSSEGWHVKGGELVGPRLKHPTILQEGCVSWRSSLDTSRVFIERLDTTRADTCWECPEGYDPLSKDTLTLCFRRRLVERSYWISCDPPDPKYDTVWDVSHLVPVVHAVEIDTTWRLIPDGFTKAEWLKLWSLMHEEPGRRISGLVDTIEFARPYYIDTCNFQLLLDGATLGDSLKWQEIR